MEISKKIKDLMEIGIKTGVGFLPGPISAAFNAIYDNVRNNVLDKRAEKWKEDVVTRLAKLEADYETIINSESFATALIKTSELAIKTESDDKRRLLSNALINTYSMNISEDKTLVFLQLVEKYTLLHIKILQYFNDDYMNDRTSGFRPQTFLSLLILKFKDVDVDYLKKTIKDLQNDYLIEEFRYDAQVDFWHHRFEVITKLGKDFYNFLKNPDEKIEP